MGFLKTIFRFLFSRFLWTLIGITILCLLIWLYGPLVSIGQTEPLSGELTRVVVIGVIVILWLIRLLFKQLRAAKANQVFVAELAAPIDEPTLAPGEENLAEVNQKFANILDQMKRSKLGGRKFLRDMPWYMFIGPPGTGKTTALRQSGLHFPIDLSDDLKGVGGTRNCDWFFTEDAVLVDTAGRYVQQQSEPDVDAAEWLGFLDMLKKHRGRRALNGVILTISLQELMEDDASLREYGREIRKRLAELHDRLEIQLPIYLMITKADLVPGFGAFFDDLNTQDREQVWGATLATETRVDGVTIEREMKALLEGLENRLVQRMAQGNNLPERASMFRFPAQMEALTAPIKTLVDVIFGESRYEESAWLRGFYFTSATQEGSPVDRMVGAIAGAFGLRPETPEVRQHGEKRSFFLRDLLSELIFPEAGLGTFDPKAEERRRWVWRGTLATSVLVTVLAGLIFLFSYMRYSGSIDDQERQLTALQGRLANVAARQAPVEPLDLNLALEAMSDVQASQTQITGGVLTAFGPSANSEIEHANQLANNHALRNILEPRMVALLEATMWREVRNPDYLLGALKSYQMMTGLAPYDRTFIENWWINELPTQAPLNPFPTENALQFQIDAIARLAHDERKFEPDTALVTLALDSICTIPLSVRAYRSLLSHPDITTLKDWIPAEKTGPNGARVLTRLSERTLRAGLPGAFTYEGFHQAVLLLVPEIAAQAALDRAVFTGGCTESSDASTIELEGDIVKLYYEDYISQWDGFLRDIRLTPISDLAQARANLKDLSSADSALKRLLVAVVAETNLTRVDEEGDSPEVPKGLLKAAQARLGRLGKLAPKAARLGGGGSTPTSIIPGTPVADHFAPLRGTIEEVEGAPPLLDDAVAALTALSNELQTVAASPDPEAALLARGGLPQLIGAIANEAAALPDPIDDWITGIAGDTIALTREAVLAQLNARWRADVLPFCTAATTGRYPFDQSSRIDVNIADFARLFGPSGLIDNFINEHLLPYVDTTARPWQWRADFDLPAERLKPFEKARSIRNGLFPGGAGPIMAFTLEPKDLTPNASRVTLNVDGQVMAYFNSASRPEPMTWPGPDGTNLISLTFTPVDGSGEIITSETGAWAWLRMIRKGNLKRSQLPELFNLTLAKGPYRARFELRANSIDNPFDLSMFGAFKCPSQF